MNITIQELSPNDFKQASKIMMEAFNYVDQDWTEETSQQYIEDISLYKYKFIAKQDEQIVGLFVAHKLSECMVVDAIGVKPEFMGKGIATQIFNHALDQAKKDGCEDVKMISDPGSLAYKWYMKLGFKNNGWVEIEKKI